VLVDKAAIAVRLFVEIANGRQAEMRQAAPEFVQVFLTQHLRLSLIGTPGHAGHFTAFAIYSP
jgi:hypothetical protein